jgi:hypothetical protein
MRYTHAEFEGQLLKDKCAEVQSQLRLDGQPEEDAFECEGKLFLHASNPALWSFSVYFIVVTLATCVLPPIQALLMSVPVAS